MRVLVDDLTDAQLDEIVAARRAAVPEYTWAQYAVAEWLATPIPAQKKRRRPELPTRMCVRCGIDTVLPEYCRDCRDVLADEVAA